MVFRLSVLVSLALALAACDKTESSAEPSDVYAVSAYGDSTQAAQGDPHAASRLGLLVKNRGVGSTNSSQLLAGTDGKNGPWAEMMKRDPAGVVVINHGINDYTYPLEQYRNNLVELVRVAREAGKVPMLELPNPVAETRTPMMESTNFDISAFEARRQTMREVAEKEGVYLCDQPRVDLIDGIHPTPDGYMLKAARLAGCISVLMGRKNFPEPKLEG